MHLQGWAQASHTSEDSPAFGLTSAGHGKPFWGFVPTTTQDFWISAVFALGEAQTADSAAFTQDLFQWGRSLLKDLSALQPF